MTEITKDDETVTSVNFVQDGDRVFYVNADGAICQLVDGSKQEQVVVKNVEDWKVSYSISSVANEYVYYTISYENNSSINGTVLYWATYEAEAVALEDEAEETEKEEDYQRNVALNTANVSARGWKEGKLVIVRQNDNGYYGMYIVASADGKQRIQILQPGFNSDSITINKIVGDKLYYTAGSVTYTKELSDFEDEQGNVVENAEQKELLGTPYAYQWSTSATLGWAAPDIVRVTVTDGEEQVQKTYMFTLGTGSVSIVTFDAEKKTNSTSTLLTKTVVED